MNKPNRDNFYEKIEYNIPDRFHFNDYIQALEAYADHMEAKVLLKDKLIEQLEAEKKRKPITTTEDLGVYGPNMGSGERERLLKKMKDGNTT